MPPKATKSCYIAFSVINITNQVAVRNCNVRIRQLDAEKQGF
jgi:hypothetical protein